MGIAECLSFMKHHIASFLVLTLVGCVDPDAPSAELLAIQETTWLVRTVDFPEADLDLGLAPGLDLDGRDSGVGSTQPGTTCEDFSEDFRSSLHPDVLGVDNAGQQLITAGQALTDDGRTFDGELEDAVVAGQIRWAIGVGTIDEEGLLPVRLFRIADGEEIEVNAQGPAAGQTLRAIEVATTSIGVSGSLASGAVETTELGGGAVYLLPFDDFEVGGLSLMAADLDHLSLELGGTFSVQALAERSASETTNEAITTEDLVNIFGGVSDIDPSADDPRRCDRLSVGLTLEAVPVEIVEE
jgi:hypothetical protein